MCGHLVSGYLYNVLLYIVVLYYTVRCSILVHMVVEVDEHQKSEQM